MPRISEDPIAQAVLRNLADKRGKDDPLGSLARAVLNGDMTLQEAARNSWHGEGIAAAVAAAIEDHARMSPEQRASLERDAGRLRSHAQPGAEKDGDNQ